MENTIDTTEQARRDEITRLQATEATRAEILKSYPRIWETKDVQNDFHVLGFMAPFCVVRRKSDNVKGSLEFTHHPRFYFNFVED